MRIRPYLFLVCLSPRHFLSQHTTKNMILIYFVISCLSVGSTFLCYLYSQVKSHQTYNFINCIHSLNSTMSAEVTMNPNNEGYPFQKLPSEVFSAILTYAINGDSASSLCSFQFVNNHWNTFIGGSESSKAWKFVCKQKFS